MSKMDRPTNLSKSSKVNFRREAGKQETELTGMKTRRMFNQLALTIARADARQVGSCLIGCSLTNKSVNLRASEGFSDLVVSRVSCLDPLRAVLPSSPSLPSRSSTKETILLSFLPPAKSFPFFSVSATVGPESLVSDASNAFILSGEADLVTSECPG